MTTQPINGRRRDILQEEKDAGLRAVLSAGPDLSPQVQFVQVSTLLIREGILGDSQPLTRGAQPTPAQSHCGQMQ